MTNEAKHTYPPPPTPHHFTCFQLTHVKWFFGQVEAVGLDELVRRLVAIDVFHKVPDGDRDNVRKATFDFGGTPTLSTLGCYIRDSRSSDGARLVEQALLEFRGSDGKHPTFNDMPDFEAYYKRLQRKFGLAPADGPCSGECFVNAMDRCAFFCRSSSPVAVH